MFLWYRDRSVSVLIVVYCGAVCFCGTESGLSGQDCSRGDRAVCPVAGCAVPQHKFLRDLTTTVGMRRTNM